MSVSSTKNIQSLITDLSGLSLIVALSYYAGYVSWISFYRLLGVDVEGQPLDYLKMGGDFFITTILNIVRFVSYSPLQAIGSLGMQEVIVSALLIALAILICLFIKLVFPAAIKWYWLGMILSAASGLGVLHQQAKSLEADQLLQIPAKNIFTKYTDTDVPVCDRNVSIYEGYLNEMKVAQPAKYNIVNRFFNMLSTEDNAYRRFKLYVALCMVIGLQIAFFSLIARPRRLSYQILILSPTLLSLILLPASYGIFGRSFSFPLVTLDIEQKEQTIHTHTVHFIGQNADQYFLYDKYDFFKIKFLPKNQVKGINQMLKSSPFDSSIPNQPAICDSLLSIPSNQIIVDF